MKYKTKISLTLVGISSTFLLLALSTMIVETRGFVFQLITNQGISVAASAAAEISGDRVEKIKTPSDIGTPDYITVRDKLRAIRDAHRNENIYIKYIYTIYPNPQKPDEFLFGVDAEETQKDFSPPGGVDSGAAEDHLAKHRYRQYSSGSFSHDQWGTWLTGYAPIYNSKGQYVGSVGADLSASFVDRVLFRLVFHGLIILFISLLAALLAAHFLAKRATRSLLELDQATREIGKGNFSYQVNLKTGDEFQTLGESMNQMAHGLLEKERMKTGFAHYMSKTLMEKIISGEGCKLEGEKRKITVLFADIKGFTKIAEQLPPEEVMEMLNEYFGAMIDIVFKHNGMLDKMIGDALMAEFGIAVDDPQQEKNALATAIEMQQTLVQLRERWKKAGRPEFHVGIGIHTGEAIVGTIGSTSQMQFTAIGDTVNTASRLERATRKYNEEIIVSEEVIRSFQGEFPIAPLGDIELAGKENRIRAYAIRSKNP